MFRALVRIAELLLGMKNNEDGPRADMYLPDFLLAFGIVLMLGGVGFGVAAAITLNIWLVVIAAGGILLGIAAVMCWKNQTIRILTSDKFEYTTFLGNTYTYSFYDITGIRKNSDSFTLFVGDKKVHIESMAIMSPRLVDSINKALERLS